MQWNICCSLQLRAETFWDLYDINDFKLVTSCSYLCVERNSDIGTYDLIIVFALILKNKINNQTMTVQYRIAYIFLDEDVSSRNLSAGSSAETGSNLQKHVLVSKNLSRSLWRPFNFHF